MKDLRIVLAIISKMLLAVGRCFGPARQYVTEPATSVLQVAQREEKFGRIVRPNRRYPRRRPR